ncbi:MAG: GNAT family N-acetyltransferase [Gemmataceae bacterium]|nr:GNAT family N-acetyltransferase [Gemmataceae bacterium]
MCDEWMSNLVLPLGAEAFRRLPRNPAYRYDYLDGKGHISPRPKHYHAVLPLPPPLPIEPPDPPADLIVRPVQAGDLDMLPEVFAAAFRHVEPFAGLTDEALRQTAHHCLHRTVRGEDGPWIREASFTAVAAGDARLTGTVFVTLLPEGDPCDWDSYHWRDLPADDCIERRLGRAHLTWIFVAPLRAAQGTGTALLSAATRQLGEMGYSTLYSTFLLGNDASLLWHWRNGFQLLPFPGSLRHIGQRFRRRQKRSGERPA